MGAVRVIPATVGHAVLAARRMRARDVREIRQLHGLDPLSAISQALSSAEFARTMFYEADLMCVYGLSPLSVLANTKRLWIFSTEAIDRHAFAFARASRRHLPELLKRFDMATNLVAEDDAPVVRWASWLGASFVLPAQEHRGRLFLQFVLQGRVRDKCRQA